MTEQTQEVTREGLKVQALLERVSALESEKADLRVDLTIYANEVQRLNQELESKNASQETEESTAPAAD